MDFALKLGLTLASAALFYFAYYRNFVFPQDILWQTRMIFAGVATCVPVILIQVSLPPEAPRFIIAFGYAALVEEGIRFLTLAYRVRKSHSNFTVLEGTMDGILLGLGFAVFENISYILTHSGYGVLLRSLSAVPMHLFAGGIMGYCLSFRRLSTSALSGPFTTWQKVRFAIPTVAALIVPVVIHGAYDLALLYSGAFNYFILIWILAGFFVLEAFVRLSRSLPDCNFLELMSLGLGEYRLLERQKEYEKWLERIQDHSEAVELLDRTASWSVPGILVALAGMCASVFVIVDRSILPEVPFEVRLTLIGGLPIVLGIMLTLASKINYSYLQDHLLRVPAVAQAVLRSGGQTYETIVMDFSGGGTFIPEILPVPVGTLVELELRDKGRRTVVQSQICWSNNIPGRLPAGLLVRFLKPGPGFRRMRLTFGFRKLRNALLRILQRS
jgi:RsiW-degrading membrane proteinase PrsW (M82 family)